MVGVGVMGAAGYTGLELMRLLAGHPRVRLVAASSRQYQGYKVAEVFPSLRGWVELSFCSPEELLSTPMELLFTATPHGVAMDLAPDLLRRGVKLVDLSADFRFRSAETYQAWYKPHCCPQLLEEAVYGLPEIYREHIRTARLVANPGCYVTSVLLALVPLLKQAVVEREMIIVDSASGVSGAGRAAKLGLIHGEVHENFSAYAVTGHRHTPEMEQELSLAAGTQVRVCFTPHLLPADRGILSTIYLRPGPGMGEEDVRACWTEAYKGEPFVDVLPAGQLPAIKDVRGTNRVALAVATDPRTGLLKVFSALDNLTKGASGQAVQNANLMLGLEETEGLSAPAVVP